MVEPIDAVARETGKTVPQIALNWLLQRPTVSTLIIGARNGEQLTPEPPRNRLDPDAGPDCAAGRGERDATALPILASTRLRRAQPSARVRVNGERLISHFYKTGSCCTSTL